MANSNERVKYYRIGEFAAIMMLKGVIHPDMQENNLGIRNGVVVTNDFADVKFFDFPEGINSKVVKQLVDALFPPMERILKDFKLMSSFRAGFISVGGLLGKSVFDELDNNGVNSFCYAPKDFDLVKKPAVNIDLIERNKRYYADWKNIIMDKLFNPDTGEMIIESLPVIMSSVCDDNKYYADQLVLLKACEELERAENELSFWITAFHFACESVNKGYVYTGYGILRKVLHLCGKALPPVVAYHAKIDELLEEHDLSCDIKEYIEKCTEYDFLELFWIVNDIDRYIQKNPPTA